jgi:CheY-like chemotaxis protein
MAALKPVTITSQNKPESGLLISPAEREDHEILTVLFRRNRWMILLLTGSLTTASELLEQRANNDCAFCVVITERDLPDGNCKAVLEMVNLVPKAPIVIVISRLADEYLWAEALNLGAYDILAKPLNQTEVCRVLNSPWIHYKLDVCDRISFKTRERMNVAGLKQPEENSCSVSTPFGMSQSHCVVTAASPDQPPLLSNYGVRPLYAQPHGFLAEIAEQWQAQGYGRS